MGFFVNKVEVKAFADLKLVLLVPMNIAILA